MQAELVAFGYHHSQKSSTKSPSQSRVPKFCEHRQENQFSPVNEGCNLGVRCKDRSFHRGRRHFDPVHGPGDSVASLWGAAGGLIEGARGWGESLESEVF